MRGEGLQQRLERETGKLEAEIAKLDKKLANEQFLAKAPEAVIGEQRARRQELAEKGDKINAALMRLKSGSLSG